MPDWYYRDDQDRTVGPLRPGELLSMIRSGELSEDTLIRKDDSQWVRSIEINGLWAAAAAPETEFYCPVCGIEISKPPVRCPKCAKFVDKAVGKIKKPSVSAKQLAKLREAATQPVERTPSTHTRSNIENDIPIPHTPRPDLEADTSSGWWRSLLPKKK
jgi:hypothetical protein